MKKTSIRSDQAPVGASFSKKRNDVLMAASLGEEHRRVAIFVLYIEFGASVDQRARDRESMMTRSWWRNASR